MYFCFFMLENVCDKILKTLIKHFLFLEVHVAISLQIYKYSSMG